MNLLDRWDRAIVPSYRRPAVTAVRGAGAVIWDEDGKSYVDMFGGIAVNSLGHAHPAVVAAVSEQVATLGHVSNMVASEPAIALAEELLALIGTSGKVFFGNSGAEANEAALKLARRTERPQIIATFGGFHGRTMGALSLTGQRDKQRPFEPMLGGITHIPYGDVAALRLAVTEQTAMVIVEPIQGEGGVIVPPADYLATAREVTAHRGTLLAIDEVQTGIGRTGAWFAYQDHGIEPDIVTLAKGLGGGLPISACLALGSTATLLQPGEHGTTFGGNPVSAAAASAVLRTVAAEQLGERAIQAGERLRHGIEGLPGVQQVRGRGLLLGVVFADTIAAELETQLRAAGFLVNAVAPDVVRLAPPLIVTNDQIDAFLGALKKTLATVGP